MSERIRLRRTKGWRLPKGAVKVDRATVFGNPFKRGEPNMLGWGEVRDAEHAVWLYRQWLVTPSRSIAYELDRHDEILRRLPTLTGHDLACWCVAGAHCHADVLLVLAARPDITEVVAMLLDGTAPTTPIERSIAIGQFCRVTGTPAEEVPNLGASIADLARQARAKATAPGAAEDEGGQAT